MSEHGGHELREAQLRFIGTILATLSHELKNHLAIIKEYSGLIQDLAEAQQPPARGPAEQYVDSVNAIHRQIGKNLELLRHFNRFSHRMDTPRAVYGVNDAVEELLALIHRLANQKLIRLEVDFHADLPQAAGDPALLQFCLFCLIQDAMGRFEKGGSLVLKTGLTKDAVTVSLISRGIVRDKGEGYEVRVDEAFHQALRRIGGTSLFAAGGNEAGLTIPLGFDAKQHRT